MPLVRRIAALAFLAVWLPALLHCRLEAAGVLFGTDCCSSEAPSAIPATDHGCTDDLCDVAEGVFTRPNDAALSEPTTCACCICLAIAVDFTAPVPMGATGGVAVSTSAPPDLRRPWALLECGTASPQAP